MNLRFRIRADWTTTSTKTKANTYHTNTKEIWVARMIDFPEP